MTRTLGALADGMGIPATVLPAFAEIFVQSSTPMLLADDDRHLIAGNAAVLELLGCDGDDLGRMRIDDIASPDARDQVPTMWTAFIAAGTMTGTFALHRQDGGEIEVDFNATANVAPGRHLSIFIKVGGASGLPTTTAEPKNTYRAHLSSREREVLRLVALGKSGPQIADALAIAPATVRVHVRNAMRKLGARTRAQAIGIAMSTGEI